MLINFYNKHFMIAQLKVQKTCPLPEWSSKFSNKLCKNTQYYLQKEYLGKKSRLLAIGFDKGHTSFQLGYF